MMGFLHDWRKRSQQRRLKHGAICHKCEYGIIVVKRTSTLIGHIVFGPEVDRVSELMCDRCGHRSNTYYSSQEGLFLLESEATVFGSAKCPECKNGVVRLDTNVFRKIQRYCDSCGYRRKV